LRTGPRGGGRTLDGILQHVRGAEIGYLSSLGGKAPRTEALQPPQEKTRQTILKTLAAAVAW
jgi:hypothetical protein